MLQKLTANLPVLIAPTLVDRLTRADNADWGIAKSACPMMGVLSVIAPTEDKTESSLRGSIMEKITMEGHLTIPFPTYAFYRARNKDATPESWERFCRAVKELATKSGVPVLGEANVVLSLRFFVQPKRGNWDLDRLANAVLDALQGVLYRNDRQVVELSVSVWRQTNEPRIEIRFGTLQGEKLIEHVAVLLRETRDIGNDDALAMARKLVAASERSGPAQRSGDP